MSQAASPTVTRWMALLWEQIQRANVPAQQAPMVLAVGLCVIHKESAGKPDARNASTGAWSLTQQVPKWYEKRWGGDRHDMRRHLEVWLEDLLRYVGMTGGYLPTANLCWASGARAAQVWVQTGAIEETVKGKVKKYSWVPKHLAYVDHLYDVLFPIYSAIAAGWLAAGAPAAPGEVNGRPWPLATPTPAGPPQPSPYDGSHRWAGGLVRAFDAPNLAVLNGGQPVTVAQAEAPSVAALPGGGGAGRVIAGLGLLGLGVLALKAGGVA